MEWKARLYFLLCMHGSWDWKCLEIPLHMLQVRFVFNVVF